MQLQSMNISLHALHFAVKKRMQLVLSLTKKVRILMATADRVMM